MSQNTVNLEYFAAEGRYSLIGGPFGSKLVSADYVSEGVPVIRGSNLNGGRFLNESSFAFVSEEKVRNDLSANLAYPGDVLFTQRGTLGQTAMIPEDSSFGTYVISQSQMKLTVDPCKADARFIYYYFSSRDAVQNILNQNSSSGVPHINLSSLRRFPVPHVKLERQRNIADLLSTYDDLIEKNRRRIALLEESARLLYREWFVHLRFPGQEHIEIVDGVPDGWDTRLLSEICTPGDGIQTGPFGSQLHQSDYTDTGVPVVMPKNIKNFRIESDGIARIPNELADKLSRHRMTVGDIVYGRRGDIGRRAFIGERQDGWFCGTGCLRIRPSAENINPLYLFETLGSPNTAGFIANQAKGSTMPNLSAGALKKVPILCPPSRFQSLFAETVEPHYEMVETLFEQNEKLIAARDLLLPRLMSGEITV